MHGMNRIQLNCGMCFEQEWDDPSVVPGKETYDDWTTTMGLGASGKISWFPHMTEEWQDTTERKTQELLESTAVIASEETTTTTKTAAATTTSPSSVRLIRDDQAYAVDGRTQSVTEL